MAPFAREAAVRLVRAIDRRQLEIEIQLPDVERRRFREVHIN